MKDLLEIRDEIDAVDAEIVRLYEKRMSLATEVADYKISTGKPVFDKAREIQKLNKLTGLATSPFTRHGVGELFEQIMAMSRKKQYQLLTAHGKAFDSGFKEIWGLDLEGKKIVYQGVDGAYSQQALIEYFGENTDCFNVATWRDAMEAIKNETADYAVLPFENSTAGIIEENYDLLNEYGYYIIAEQKIKVNHCILGTPDCDIDNIKTVYSHPQALAQCSKLLGTHPDWKQVPLVNTALSAKKVKEDNDNTQVAIASRLTSDLYGLKILSEGIQNESTNETRFVIVTKKKEFLNGASKVSISLELKHESGSLYHVLSHFIYNNLNMTSIESRPLEGKNWEYRFFIDFDGNLNDPEVQNALRGLMDDALDLKVFGNY